MLEVIISIILVPVALGAIAFTGAVAWGIIKHFQDKK